eukprot:m.347386 g.347386  ORF g.347386 m.347386 type:complete len:572 (-) comp32587_c0_seq1:69-1784(-)
MAVLVLGDGDLSFTLSAIRGADEQAARLFFGFKCNTIIATTFDTKEELSVRYGCALKNAKLLQELGVTVCHGVDATEIQTTLAPQLSDWESISIRRVVFCFPHCKGRTNVKKTRALLHGIFASLAQCGMWFKDTSRDPGDWEFLLSLCRGQGGTNTERAQAQARGVPLKRQEKDHWEVLEKGATFGFVLKSLKEFPADVFVSHGYQPSGFRNQSRGFQLSGALVHIFSPSPPTPYSWPKEIRTPEGFKLAESHCSFECLIRELWAAKLHMKHSHPLSILKNRALARCKEYGSIRKGEKHIWVYNETPSEKIDVIDIADGEELQVGVIPIVSYGSKFSPANSPLQHGFRLQYNNASDEKHSRFSALVVQMIEAVIGIHLQECHVERDDIESHICTKQTWKLQYTYQHGPIVLAHIPACGSASSLDLVLNLDTIALVLCNLPDLRLLWSKNQKLIESMGKCIEGKCQIQLAIAEAPAYSHDISLWVDASLPFVKAIPSLYDCFRCVAGNTLAEVNCITDEKNIHVSEDGLKKSYCFRLIYHSLDCCISARDATSIQLLVRAGVSRSCPLWTVR